MSYSTYNQDTLTDDEDGFASEMSAFTEKSIRMGFIRKVYSILLAQMTVTIAFIAMFLYIKPLQEYSMHNPWLWVIAMVMTFVCLIALACCPDVRRNFPTNMILLGVFTICESFLLGAAASCYKKEEVLMAAGITAAVVLGLTIFAMQTKYDFTMCSGALLVILIVLFVFGILAIFIQNKVVSIVYASLGALVFSMYLVFDTQLMMGGKHQYSISPEEYIFAALNLYLDIINIFMFILSIIGQSRN